jgi:FkbM family methyltransferase
VILIIYFSGMIGRLIKKSLVATGFDVPVAYLSHRLKSRLLKRLIPAPSYYRDQTRIVTRDGIRYRVKPSDLSQWFVFSGNNDRHVEAAVYSIRKGNGAILDIGANIGHFSLPVSKRFPGRKVIAFEPNPLVYEQLMKNISLNEGSGKDITVHSIALGEKEEMIKLSIPFRNSGAGTLLNTYTHEPHHEFMVNIRPLDQLINFPVDFIKIDVEEFEYSVLKGARNLLKTYHPAIYMETSNTHPHQKEIFQFLSDLGYRFERETSDGYAAMEPDAKTLSKMDGVNNVLARVV